jgi:hypothetical protein
MKQMTPGTIRSRETPRSVLFVVFLLTAHGSLLTAVGGCESLQRKFTRKPKHPPAAPTPIVTFLDYSRAVTPLDRYRKHTLMFQYWNEQLVESLKSPTPSPKRIRHASGEALGELRTLRTLLSDDVAARLEGLIEARSEMDRRLKTTPTHAAQAATVARELESQSRAFEHNFSWRDVQESLRAEAEE